jgi:hypothetical protein
VLDGYVVPIFACPAPEVYGHHCNRPRGHRGGHQCSCGVIYSTTPSQWVTPHDPFHWPESNAA